VRAKSEPQSVEVELSQQPTSTASCTRLGVKHFASDRHKVDHPRIAEPVMDIGAELSRGCKIRHVENR
jgi:hypothetical protein